MVYKDSENDDPKALLRCLKNKMVDTDWWYYRKPVN